MEVLAGIVNFNPAQPNTTVKQILPNLHSYVIIQI